MAAVFLMTGTSFALDADSAALAEQVPEIIVEAENNNDSAAAVEPQEEDRMGALIAGLEKNKIDDVEATEEPIAEKTEIGEAISVTREDVEDDTGNKKEEQAEISDPIEPVNRAMFAFNDFMYWRIFRPVSDAYDWALPEPVRDGISNFIEYVNIPGNTARCLLEFDLQCFAIGILRAVVNAPTLGFCDLASYAGIPKQRKTGFSDFLGGILQIPQGPMLTLPIAGTHSVRVMFGDLVDRVFSLPSLLGLASFPASLAYGTVDTVSAVSGYKKTYDDLTRSAVDPYSAIAQADYEYNANKERKTKEASLLPIK